MVGPLRTSKNLARRTERRRHALWAGLISLILAAITLLDPIDQILWVTQNRVVTSEPSGDIVYIGSEHDLADPNFSRRREKLATLIDRLDRADVDAVYVDVVFDEGSTPQIDAELNRALRNFDGSIYLVNSVGLDVNRQDRWQGSIADVGEGIDVVGNFVRPSYMGYEWQTTGEIALGGEVLPNLGASLAGVEASQIGDFPIDYSIPLDSFDTLSFQEATDLDTDLKTLEGRIVVIGNQTPTNGITFDVPGYPYVSSTIVHIYAAETLKAGKTQFVHGSLVAVCFFLLILMASILRRRKWRHVGYALIMSALPVGLIVTAVLGWRTGFADAGVMVLLFGIMRLRSLWKESVALVDQETNLPSFAALEADKEASETVPAIIVARIHRFEQVRRTLPKELHADYVLAITSRLKAATQDATIYLGQGHMIAWTLAEKDPALLHEHLEGLRALFSSPLLVGDQQVDVGISFGVDITPSPNVARRLASAAEAAERTNETFDPIAIADTASEEDLIWNISLQARIDAALANREIYLAYQPKVMVQTGEIVGVEALVRWKDPVKGHIPPDNFIRQCETAGRMSHLTRYVLIEACKAGNAFEDAGLGLPMAVNISATLVHEPAIVRMVSEVLEETGFEPRRLTLEITETYRISNIDRAAEILGDLAALGCKISMDDFGVGAASLEALLRLPFSELKIDRTFISHMTSCRKAEGIVRNVLQMGKDMRIIVVAEGVEDAGTLTLLRESGCLVAQGFGISRPVDFNRILKFQMDKGRSLIKNMV